MFTDKPQCIIHSPVMVPDALTVLSAAHPFVELTIDSDAVFVRQLSGPPIHISNIDLRLAIATGSGMVDTALPAASDCTPDALTWTFSFPDGSTLAGHVTDEMVTVSQVVPLSFMQLKNTYGWVFNSPIIAASSEDPAQASLAASIAGSLVIFNDPDNPTPLFVGGSPLLLR